MIRVQHQISLSIGDDSDASRLALLRANDDPSLCVSTTQFGDYLVGSIVLPGDGTVVELPFSSLQSARGLYLELLGGKVLACLNPSSGPQSLYSSQPGVLMLQPAGTAPSGDPLPAHLYLDSGVSRLFLASASGQTITGTFAIWGLAPGDV